MFGEGISLKAMVFEEAIQLGIIERKGSYYKFSGEIIGQGKGRAREYLEANPEVFALIEREVADCGTEDEEEEEKLAIDAEEPDSNPDPEGIINLED
jgi:recombination protein RecA